MAAPRLPRPASALDRARRLGVLGPGPIDAHVAHAAGFLDALATVPAGGLVVDLGSGGGVPGLVVAEARPDLRIVLLDAMEKRTALLDDAVVAMGIADRVRVVTGRAEVLGRDDELRGTADRGDRPLVRPAGRHRRVRRSPARASAASWWSASPRTAPTAGPPTNWPPSAWSPPTIDVPGMKVLRQATPCPAQYPRRNGLPAKRPLF